MVITSGESGTVALQNYLSDRKVYKFKKTDLPK